MAENESSGMPKPFSEVRGRGRRPGSKTIEQEPAPLAPGPRPPRAIVGAGHGSQVTTESYSPPPSVQITGLPHQQLVSCGRGFLKNTFIRPMEDATKYKLLCMIAEKKMKSNQESSEFNSVVRSSSEQSLSSNASSVSLTSNQGDSRYEPQVGLHHHGAGVVPHVLPYQAGGEVRTVTMSSSSHPRFATPTNLPQQQVVRFSGNFDVDHHPVHSVDYTNWSVGGVEQQFHQPSVVNQPTVVPSSEKLQITIFNQPSHSRETSTPEFRFVNAEIPRSNLNVNAQEFVPFVPIQWSSGDNAPASSDVDQYHYESPELVNYDPTPTQVPTTETQTGGSYQKPVPSFIDKIPPSILEVTDDPAINVLKAALARLIQMPGNMEEAIFDLNSSLNLLISKQETLMEMVNIIFELVVDQHPFAYTAARLCKHLFYVTPVQEPQEGKWRFRTELITRIQQLFKERNTMDPNRQQGFALFIAEVYLSCTVDDEKESKIEILAAALVNLLKDMIRSRQPQLLKAAIKVLKCTGVALDDRDLEKDEEKKNMQELYALVEAEAPNCPDDTVRSMAQKLLEFRRLNWGRDDESAAPPPLTGKQISSEEPVFFSALGVPISREEAGYSDGDYTHELMNASTNSPDLISDEEEPDFDSAYADFLVSSGQINPY